VGGLVAGAHLERALAHEVDRSTDEAAWVPLTDVDAPDRVGLVDVARRLAGLLPG
jgi:8-oxo-dGTP diphosphatase